MPAKINVKSQADSKLVKQRLRPPRLSEVNRQSIDRRAQIGDAAARLFAEFGYAATTVRQIADEVNILAGSLYHHFATKEDMLHGFLKARLAQLTRDNQRIAHLPVNAEHRFVASVIMRFKQYVDDWEFHAILLQEARFFRRHKDFAYVVAAKASAFKIQQVILREGMETGLFRLDIDTYLMIGTISRTLSSAAAWFRSGDNFSSDKPLHYSLDTVIDFHLDSALRLVRSPARLAEPIPRATCQHLLKLEIQASTAGDCS